MKFLIKSGKIAAIISLLIFTGLFFAGQGTAGTLTFDYDVTFSGVSPAGPAPYLTSTFDDTSAASGYDVRLTVFAGNLDPTYESITKLYFNLNPSLDASLLTFQVASTDPGNTTPNSVTGKDNDYKADGDGLYDIYFDMPPPPGDMNARFTDNETLIYDIGYSGGASLTAQSFNFISFPDGGEGEYFAAAHVQGINVLGCDPESDPGCDSGWVAVVPEPISSTLFMVGAATLGFRRFRKRKSIS